jgi:hypothetical protein
MAQQEFYLREGFGDVAAMRILAEYQAALPFTLDIDVAAGAALSPVATWLTGPAFPGLTLWPAGAWTLDLQLAAAPAVLSYTAQIWRAGPTGLDLVQVGSQPATQTGTGLRTFSFTGTDLTTVKTDRLKLKILAANTDAINLQRLSLLLTGSRLVTALPLSRTARRRNSLERRSRFLHRPRPGERRGEFGPGGVPVV